VNCISVSRDRLAVVPVGKMFAVTLRGVRASLDSRMVNSSFYGEFLTDPNLKASFLQEALALEEKR
jgi:hypothetical protein